MARKRNYLPDFSPESEDLLIRLLNGEDLTPEEQAMMDNAARMVEEFFDGTAARKAAEQGFRGRV